MWPIEAGRGAGHCQGRKEQERDMARYEAERHEYTGNRTVQEGRDVPDKYMEDSRGGNIHTLMWLKDGKERKSWGPSKMAQGSR